MWASSYPFAKLGCSRIYVRSEAIIFDRGVRLQAQLIGEALI